MGRYRSPLLPLHLLAAATTLRDDVVTFTAGWPVNYITTPCAYPCENIDECIDDDGKIGTYGKAEDDIFPGWANSVQCGTVDCIDGTCRLEAWKEVDDPCGFDGTDCSSDSECEQGPKQVAYVGKCVSPFFQCEYWWCPVGPDRADVQTVAPPSPVVVEPPRLARPEEDDSGNIISECDLYQGECAPPDADYDWRNVCRAEQNKCPRCAVTIWESIDCRFSCDFTRCLPDHSAADVPFGAPLSARGQLFPCPNPCTSIDDCLDPSGKQGTFPKVTGDTNQDANVVECGTVSCNEDGLCELLAWRADSARCGHVNCGNLNSNCNAGPTELAAPDLVGTCTGQYDECEYKWCPADSGQQAPSVPVPTTTLDEEHDRNIVGINSGGRYYQVKVYLRKDHVLHQPAFYTEEQGCLDVRVMMSDDILTNEELDAGELDEGWQTMCRGHVPAGDMDNNERTYMLPKHCQSFEVPAYHSKFLFIGVIPKEPGKCFGSVVPDWASECDCFLRWNGTKIYDEELPWDQQPHPPSSSSSKGSSKGSKEAKAKSGSAKAKSGSGSGDSDCDSCGKPASIRLKYIGGGCGQSTQGLGDKHDCSGDTMDGAVDIRVTSKGESEFLNVLVGGEFVHDPGEDKLDSNTEVEVRGRGGSGLQQFLDIHTSCSAPLNYNDIFGSIQVLSWYNSEGDPCGPAQARS